MKLFALLLACALPLTAMPAAAQTKTHKWQDALCANTVRYDPRKVDQKALVSTAEILNSEQDVVPLPPFVGTLQDIAKNDPESFAKGCAAQAARMRALTLLPIDGIEAYRQERARQIDDACAFGTAHAKGYREPSALRAYAPASPHCDAFVDAMEGKTDLTAFWRKRVVENCANNASPAACRQRYETLGGGPDGEAQKRLYLVGFGWGNCATNHTAFNGESAKRGQAMREKVDKVFRRTYRVKQQCDEP